MNPILKFVLSRFFNTNPIAIAKAVIVIGLGTSAIITYKIVESRLSKSRKPYQDDFPEKFEKAFDKISKKAIPTLNSLRKELKNYSKEKFDFGFAKLKEQHLFETDDIFEGGVNPTGNCIVEKVSHEKLNEILLDQGLFPIGAKVKSKITNNRFKVLGYTEDKHVKCDVHNGIWIGIRPEELEVI